MGGVFGITGIGTALIAWALAIGGIAAVTRSWPRLARPGGVAIAERILAQLLVTVLLALAVGVTVNRAGLWFVSWRDLASVVTGPPAGDLTQHGAELPPPPTTPSRSWGAADVEVVPSKEPSIDAHTGLRVYRVAGRASGYAGTVYAWVPPSGAVRSALQVFHGYPVSAQSAFANLGLGRHAAGVLRHTVVLIPDWSPGELDSECVDGPAVKMETWLTTDVPAWAVATFGVRPQREAWATLGYSAGGWCAAMATMRHPRTYAAGISMGGYMRPEFASSYRPVDPVGGPYDLPLLARREAPDVALLVQYSEHDVHVAPSSRELVAAARPPLSVTQWSSPDSGHRVGAWKPLIPRVLAWLDHAVPDYA